MYELNIFQEDEWLDWMITTAGKKFCPIPETQAAASTTATSKQITAKQKTAKTGHNTGPSTENDSQHLL